MLTLFHSLLDNHLHDKPCQKSSCGSQRVAGELLFHPISPMIPQDSLSCYHSSMRHLVVLFIQIALAFNIQIDKDVVRRILAHHYLPGQDSDGPSWLTFLGHMKDSLWSIDLFRCESARLRSHWVLVVMDQYTRRIIGFGVHAGRSTVHTENAIRRERP